MTETLRPISAAVRIQLPAPVTEYFVPIDPMDDLQCESCQ